MARRMSAGSEGPSPFDVANQLTGVQDPYLQAGVEGASVEGIEQAGVGLRVRPSGVGRQGWVLLHEPLARQ